MRLEQRVSLVCPAILAPPGTARNVNCTFAPSGLQANLLDTVGQELRLAFAAMGKLIDAATDNDFWRRKCRELCLRPAAEPLLLAHWDRLKSFAMTEAQMASFCSLLCGSKHQARTKDSYGLWDGGDVRFEPAEQAKAWWDDIRAVANKPELKSLLPAYCFARTIIAHPYPDGNGRLARALVHAALARNANLAAPVLPLAPAFYMNGAKIAAALRDLSDTGDWDAFNVVFLHVLMDAAVLSDRVAAVR